MDLAATTLPRAYGHAVAALRAGQDAAGKERRQLEEERRAEQRVRGDSIAANRKVQDLRLLEDEVVATRRRVEDLRRAEASARSPGPSSRQHAERHLVHHERMVEDRKRNEARRRTDAEHASARQRGDAVDVGWVAEREEQFRGSLQDLKAEEAKLIRARDGVVRHSHDVHTGDLHMKQVLSQAFDRLQADASPRGSDTHRNEILLRKASSRDDTRAVFEARQAIRLERDQVGDRARLYDRFARHPDLAKFLDRMGPDRNAAKTAFQEREGNRVDRERLLNEVDPRTRGSSALVPFREDRYARGTWDKYMPAAPAGAVEAERKAMAVERFELLPKDVRLGVLKMVEDREKVVADVHRARKQERQAAGELKALRERYDNRSWIGRAADRVANTFTGQVDADLARKAKLEKAFSKPLLSDRIVAANKDILRADPGTSRMLDKLAEKSKQGEFDRNVPLPAQGQSSQETRGAGDVGRLDGNERDRFTDVYGEKHWDPDQQRQPDDRAAKPPEQGNSGQHQRQQAQGRDPLAELDGMVPKAQAPAGRSQPSQKDKAQAEARAALQRQAEIDEREKAKQLERGRGQGVR